MALLDWKNEYALGIAPLDFEHKDLFERINDLYDSCARTGDPSNVSACLGRLHARLSAHFALEEQTMRDTKNPHYAAHKAEHDRFLDEITGAVASFGTGAGPKDIGAFARQVRDWIVGHITTFDRQLIKRGA